MNLEDLRKKIDQADEGIVRLIGERIKIAQKIGRNKKEQGRNINDREREKAVLAHIKSLAQEENISENIIESVYKPIVIACKRAQGKEVAFQGEAGAYSEEAALQFFGPAVATSSHERLDDVFKAVERDEVEFGIIPVENSMEGSISRSYDLMLESTLKVRGELELRVSHCLIANPGASLNQIRKIYSHPQALGQCKSFFKHLKCELIPARDTAGSVKMVKEKKITDGAAIASARAAEIYGMEIIAREIEDNPDNRTRFFILSKEDSPPSGNDKTSIVFSVKHQPKALYDFLKVFASRDINLTKIESRPTGNKPWEYNFYLDFDGHPQDEAPRQALADLERNSLFLKILGAYPKAK